MLAISIYKQPDITPHCLLKLENYSDNYETASGYLVSAQYANIPV